jgi:signal transduction histidine kinase
VKKQTMGRGAGSLSQQKALLIALSDDLTLPLLQIRSSLELLQGNAYTAADMREQTRLMAMSAENGLQLTEAYRLVLQLDKLHEMPMEPVAIGAVLEEVAHQLSPYASEYATSLEVDIQGRLSPVLAHRPSLTAAIQCLSSSLIRAQAGQSRQTKYQLILGAHKSNGEIATGVFSDMNGLSDRTLRAARSLAGRARQPMPALPAGAASGVLIADVLCGAMWQPLRAAAHRHMNGLAVTVPATKQLSFV